MRQGEERISCRNTAYRLKSLALVDLIEKELAVEAGGGENQLSQLVAVLPDFPAIWKMGTY